MQCPRFLCMTGQVHPLCVISGERIKEINGQIPGAGQNEIDLLKISVMGLGLQASPNAVLFTCFCTGMDKSIMRDDPNPVDAVSSKINSNSHMQVKAKETLLPSDFKTASKPKLETELCTRTLHRNPLKRAYMKVNQEVKGVLLGKDDGPRDC